MSNPENENLAKAVGLLARSTTVLRGVVLAAPADNDLLPELRRVTDDMKEATRLAIASGIVPIQTHRQAPNPLRELAIMERSRPQAEALLETLRRALPQAEALDAARGIADSADLGDTLQQLVSRLELELYGPMKR